jgi:hypothetical protein
MDVIGAKSASNFGKPERIAKGASRLYSNRREKRLKLWQT